MDEDEKWEIRMYRPGADGAEIERTLLGTAPDYFTAVERRHTMIKENLALPGWSQTDDGTILLDRQGAYWIFAVNRKEN